MLDSRLDLSFDVLHAATGNSSINGDNVRIINFGPTAFFSNYDLTSSSGKHQKSIDYAHIVFLKFKLLISARESDDLSIGFHRSGDNRKQELTTNKNKKGNKKSC